jgi:cation transport ATPase
MLEYVHFVPGRLRLKIARLRHRATAAAAEAYASAIPGVVRAAANPSTGSLTINFDEQELSISDLWKRLQAQHYISSRCSEPTAIGWIWTGDSHAIPIGRAVMKGFADALFEQVGRALMRGLL